MAPRPERTVCLEVVVELGEVQKVDHSDRDVSDADLRTRRRGFRERVVGEVAREDRPAQRVGRPRRRVRHVCHTEEGGTGEMGCLSFR
jgi:hypothetical protein